MDAGPHSPTHHGSVISNTFHFIVEIGNNFEHPFRGTKVSLICGESTFVTPMFPGLTFFFVMRMSLHKLLQEI